MAVTFEQEPSPWQASDNPIVYVFSSDQTAQPNFSFKLELRVDGQIVHADKVFVETDNRAHYDVSSVVRYMVGTPAIIDALHSDAGTARTIQLTVTESYGDPAVNQASQASTITNTWKSRQSDVNYIQYDYDGDFKLKKWLTDHPTNDIRVLRNQDVPLSMIGGGSAGLILRFYDSSDSLLHTYNTNQTYDLWQLNLNAELLTSGAGVPDITLVSYYTAKINLSELITFRYLDDYRYEPTSLVWVNQYGAFDTMVFEHSHIQSGQVESSSYTKQFGGWNGSNYEFSTMNTGKVDYFKRDQLKGSIATGFMTEEVNQWLVKSVYIGLNHIIYKINSDAYPIRITSSSYEVKQSRFEDLINEQINFDVAYDNSSPVL